MIYLYSGTPGSGKSLHAIADMERKIVNGGNVIANFPIALDRLKGNKRKAWGDFVYLTNEKLTVEYLMDYAAKHHVKGVEGQTLIVFDEAQVKFNPRDYSRADRMGFINFFTIHRHLGFNVILITQNDRFLDRQIRCLIEYELKHRKLNNYGIIGGLIPFSLFVAVEYWYGVKERCSCSYFRYRKRIGKLYDSYALFDGI